MNRDFLAELKRRNVIRMAGLYLVGAWLITQVADTVLPMFGAPLWLPRSIVIMLAIGLLPALVFAWVFELTPKGLKRDAEVDPAESIAPQTAKRLDRMIMVVLLLALGYFGIDKFMLAPTRDAALQVAAEKQGAARAVTQQAAKADAAALEKSIAVLPLVNASGDPDQQYFSDGLSEDLIIALSQFDGLKVISRNSAFQFRDSDASSKTIGARLGVAHLLEGSVRHADDVVRITVQLVKAADGSTVWSQRFDRPFKDLFALQDEITQAVAGALKTQLLSQAHAGAVVHGDRPPSGNLEAYTAYLQGRFHASRNTQPDLQQAIAYYAKATKLDPAYAQAWAKLSLTWADMAAFFLGGEPQQQAYGQARVAANRALALDPNLAAAHIARGYVFLVADFNWTGAEAEYRRALELAPNDGEAIFFLGDLLATLGQPAQAVVMTREALATDPLNTAMYNLLFQYLSALGRLDEAEQAIRKAIELQPNAEIYHAQLANLEIQRGDAKAALAAARKEPDESGFRKTAVALALQIGDDRAAADAALKDLIDTQAVSGAFQIAQAYALRRDPDRMFEWLDRAWANRDPGISQLLYDPFIMLYQDDSRLAAYRRKVGLPVSTVKARGDVQ